MGLEKSSDIQAVRITILGLLVSCAAYSPQVSECLSAQTEPAAPQTKGAIAAAAGITWNVPSRWKLAPPRRMRVATYDVPAVRGDPEDGECAVYFFGVGQGGSVEANLKRWAGQFEQPDGRASDAVAQREKKQIAGLAITTMSLSGTYLASAGPMSPVKERKPNFRLLAAIVEAPKGLVFFKFTGPTETVKQAEAEFRMMLDSLRRQERRTQPLKRADLVPLPPNLGNAAG